MNQKQWPTTIDEAVGVVIAVPVGRGQGDDQRHGGV
jgi:hypothetical protein